jgi:predicted ribosome quality control (RQC) complex YloA/Tae2 family protein
MLSNYYTLATVAADLALRIGGKTIREAYTQERNTLIVSFESIGESLVVSCSPDINTLYLHPDFSRARNNSVDVLKACAGTVVKSVMIQPGDRVVSVSLTDALTLHCQFFGPKANVLLVNSSDGIVDAFKNARTLTGKEYLPSSEEMVQDINLLETVIREEPGETVLAILKRTSQFLGATLVSEILFRANIPSATRAGEIADDGIHRLQVAFSNVLAELSHPTPRMYVAKEPPHTPYRFSLVRLEHCHEFDEKFFPDIHEGIRFFISRTQSSGTVKSHASQLVATLHQHRTKLQRTIAAIEDDLAKTERADEYERNASLLMANLSVVGKGAKTVALSNGSDVVEVTVEPRLTPAQNAQRYFEKAKKSRVSYAQSRERLAGLRSRMEQVTALLAAAETIHTKEEFKTFMSERMVELAQFGVGEKAKEREQLPFRIFTVDGGFEVWAGKSSRNNDELTMKYAKPNDLWFHARGASGSHVILKTTSGKGEPGKKAKEQAAAIAAYYSKMKNAKMVPVAMTEKKYVRKPKGAPPGTVVIEREKVIFAEPALPENSEQ